LQLSQLAARAGSFCAFQINMAAGVVCPPAIVATVKNTLERNGVYDAAWNARKLTDGRVMLPVLANDTTDLDRWLPADLDAYRDSLTLLHNVEFQPSRSARAQTTTPQSKLEAAVMAWMARFAPDTNADVLIKVMPDKWEHYTDFVLLPETAFMDDAWQSVLIRCTANATALYASLAAAFGVSHLARKARIPADDILRRPRLAWLHRSTPPDEPFWASTRQHGLTYWWAPEHTMFCAGNITEKKRVAFDPIFKCRNDEIVLDLYGGVGYFTLPYIIHAGARRVHACEWNPWSVKGLERGLITNGVPYSIASRDETGNDDARVIVYPGDNASWVDRFEKTVDRVNLGLLPTSEQGWPLAVRALRPAGGWFHVHVNLMAEELTAWQNRLIETLLSFFAEHHLDTNWTVNVQNVECVKSFAPRVFHYVADVECRPCLA
jgi:tRNA G37 N-methylase Trm5